MKIKKILFSTPALFLYICAVVWAAQQTIVSTDTLNQAWTKQNANNTEVYSHTTNTLNPHTVTPTQLSLVVGTDVQAYDVNTSKINANETVTGNRTYTGAIDTTGASSNASGPLVFTSTATPPATDGKLTYLSGVTGWTSKIFTFYSTAVQYILSYDTLPTVNGSVPTYNATNDDIDWEDPRAIKTATYATSQSLTVEECRGYVVYVTGAATITLPAIADGMSVSIITIGAVAVSVDPNVSDLIYLDGTSLDDGDKITNTSTTGDIAVLTYYSGVGWYATTNSWTDGGA